MTNNWTDIGNATCVIVMGANPAENHPACMAHINRARTGPHAWTDRAGNAFTTNKPAAKLIVIDPRQTRLARQADLYVRIRPGTDIAFINGVMNHIINNISGQEKTNWETFLNQSVSRTFQADDNTTVAVPDASSYTDARFRVNGTSADYLRAPRVVSGKTITDFPVYAATFDGATDTVFMKLKVHVAEYTLSRVADICGCTEAQIAEVANCYMENSRFASYDPAAPSTIVFDPKSAYYRSTTMLYAMGLTQHTCASQSVKSFATLQSLLGNMGRSGGGINALRGIHNVQGSTDMGLLYHLIPGYSGNPGSDPVYGEGQTFAQYMDKLYGVRLSGGGYADVYDPSKHGLQQAGFYQMTRKFFGDTTVTASGDIDKLYALWPKTNGDNHIAMFRKMAAGTITAAVVWGQNPAVSESNQVKVREGLYNLDTLVCVDMFENETAAVGRKAGSVTYLLPACSHVEEAGSATNSGRVLQWRYQARKPAGNSKSDLELLLRLAKALDTRPTSAFKHISDVWGTIAGFSYTSVYDKLYGSLYGYDGTGNFEAAANTLPAEPIEYVSPTMDASGVVVTGSEFVAERLYREMCEQVNKADPVTRGTLWIYTLGYAGSPGSPGSGQGGGWTKANRSKQRISSDADGSGGGHYLWKNWGYAWLVNRRVFYNNGETPWDQTDGFQGPDQCARLFVSTNTGLIDYSRTYRHVHRLSDMPKDSGGATPSIHKTPGRFPSHTEPYETPRDGAGAGTDLIATWGKNSKNTGYQDLVIADGGSPIGSSATYPLVLTTFRCVEHFQGGPITRNNPWNHEAEPEPWIEINSVDANANGIADGDYVKVVTARTDGLAGDMLAPYGNGFRARVGVGLASNQRVGPGVVGIPWHWGEKGLSTGSRANDLTLDAMDANTTIPEYKACLCRLVKM